LAKLESRGGNHSASFTPGIHRRREIEYQPGILIQRKSDESPRKTSMEDAAHPMAIGLDLGTSGVKAVLLSVDGRLRAEASCAPALQRPRPLWSGQHPADWIAAVDNAVRALRRQANDADWTAVRALAIAGQMHGAVLLDHEWNLLRPAILWDDGRSQAQCGELARCEPQ
jgi:xylulokinase